MGQSIPKAKADRLRYDFVVFTGDSAEAERLASAEPPKPKMGLGGTMLNAAKVLASTVCIIAQTSEEQKACSDSILGR